MSKFSRWLIEARRLFGRSMSARRSPSHNVRWNCRLETRLAPATFSGGVTVATGDVDGDRINDMITGAGPGGSPLVKVFSGKTGHLIRQFNAFDSSFTGGVFVAAGDVNGDGRAEVIVGAGAGNLPKVRVFDVLTGITVRDFDAFSRHFKGGVRVAAAEFTGDNRADIVTAAGPGGSPVVQIYNGQTGALIFSQNGLDARFNGGVYVAAGDITGDGRPDLVVGSGEGGPPIVSVINPFDAGRVNRSFFAYDPNFRGGVRVAVGNLQAGGADDIITAAGPGGGPHVQVFNSATGASARSFFAYDSRFVGGVFVARSDFDGSGADEIVTGPGVGGGPNVRGFDGDTLAIRTSFFAYEADGGTVFSPGPFAKDQLDLIAPTLTITSPTDSPTQRTNLTVTGKVTDNKVGGLASVNVSIDGGASQTVSFNSSTGDFTFTTTFPLLGTADGPHSLVFTARDKSNNASQAVTVNFTLKSTIASPTITLDDASDTGTKGDFITSVTPVTINGVTEAGASVRLNQTNTTVTADGQGKFSFSGLTLVDGSNSFSVVVTDSLGNTNTRTFTITKNSGPQVEEQLVDIEVPINSAARTINLRDSFTDVDVVGTIIQFNTSAGPVTAQLLDRDAPLTVANFLRYIDAGRFNQSVFHRLVAGFVLQGGGYQFNEDPSRLDEIPDFGQIPNEFGASNLRGTIAMAKLGGQPNSASSEFFFNLGNNSANLDNQNGGFTVFGNVTSGLDVIDQLASFSVSNQGGVFNEIPLRGYSGNNFPTDTNYDNYAGLLGVQVTRSSDRLTFSVAANDNEGLVTASVVGNNLTLNFTPGQTGVANITIRATDLSGQFVEQTFSVTVNP